MSECCNTLSNKFKPVTHVILDLDGTLMDTEKIYAGLFSDLLSEYNQEYTRALMNKVMGKIEPEACQIIVEELKLPTTPEEFRTKFRELAPKRLEHVELMPGAAKLVQHLYDHNVPIAIATSSAQDSFDIKSTHHKPFFAQFSHVVCGTDKEVKHGKPAPDIFLVCASRFPETPDTADCLVFEDAPSGVKGALQAGMQVVMMATEYIPYETWKEATLRLDSFDDFMPQLFGLPAYGDPESIIETPDSITDEAPE